MDPLVVVIQNNLEGSLFSLLARTLGVACKGLVPASQRHHRLVNAAVVHMMRGRPGEVARRRIAPPMVPQT